VNRKREWKTPALIAVVFLGFFYLPVGYPRFDNAVMEALHLTRWYAREHVLFCLVPAFFIAGAVSTFLNRAAVMRYLGADADKTLAYGVASVSGAVLAVCSCTVLPLFSGIYRMGAGLGPATAFLYSGPAVNVLAVILTARILGIELGVARAVGAVVFSIVIGLLMHLIFRRGEHGMETSPAAVHGDEVSRPLWMNVLYFASMTGVLVFANFGKPADDASVWRTLYESRWTVTAFFALALAVILVVWFGVRWWKMASGGFFTVLAAAVFPGNPLPPFVTGLAALSVAAAGEKGEVGEWFEASWGFAKQILPLLLAGVLMAGALLGRPGHEGLIPSGWVAGAVGGNSLAANFFASFAGAFMYFATLTEVPILQGLIGSGMGKGPALALLLAGPTLSLPNMLVIRSVMGTRKTIVFVALVVVMATASGVIFGMMFE